MSFNINSLFYRLQQKKSGDTTRYLKKRKHCYDHLLAERQTNVEQMSTYPLERYNERLATCIQWLPVTIATSSSHNLLISSCCSQLKFVFCQIVKTFFFTPTSVCGMVSDCKRDYAYSLWLKYIYISVEYSRLSLT